MARIELDAVAHSYDGTERALEHVHETFEDGGAYALLGPSGCGKTTLLSIISGLIRPSEGRVLLDGANVTDADARTRNIAQVFQFPVVYEAMTVRENLAFPLKNRGVETSERDKRVAEIIDALGLGDCADRGAGRLTPDLKQKISLGRGLVRSDVAAILLDEPLTTIDPALKWELRRQLKALHRQMRRTMIYVTHDQSEALTFAEKVAVMHEGRIVQIGTARELFEAARHTFVGHFIGSPGMNVLPAAVAGAQAEVGGHAFALSGPPRAPLAGAIEIGVRPEDVVLGREGAPVAITRVDDIGRLQIVSARLSDLDLTIVLEEGVEIPADPKVAFPPERVGLYADSWRVELG
ncbi:MAG: ABC transporter ATP-binding protein [Maricaulaceae bacterium]|jgi:glycerol transport system ATP-binding protein